MSKLALAFGFGGFADLDLTFGEFFHSNHTVALRFMSQHPYGDYGPMLAENGNGTYLIGQGDFRQLADSELHGAASLWIQIGSAQEIYPISEEADNQVGGPAGYRNHWQHLAVVRSGNTIRVYLNGAALKPKSGTELQVPSAGLPTDTTPLRLGRRTTGVSDSSKWYQFYGLLDDLAVFTRALSESEIQRLAEATSLRDHRYLLAGWLFDNEFQSPKLSRPVTLPTAADIPHHVTEQAEHPVPVYYVEVSPDRNSEEDARKLDLRPSRFNARLPLGAGEWWTISQGWEDPTRSHNGFAAYCWDFKRVNGVTLGARIFAAGDGRVIYEADANTGIQEEGNSLCVIQGRGERVVYMHLKNKFFSKYFPAAPIVLADGSIPQGSQPAVAIRDPVGDVGQHPKGPHLHFQIAAIEGTTFDTSGRGTPCAFTQYYQSWDEGKTWRQVRTRIPQPGDLIAYYPWSPWGDREDALSVAPAVSSRAANRLDIFVRGENSHLWLQRWTGAEWTVWEDLGGGEITSAPAAVSWGQDRIDVFARAHRKNLYHRHWWWPEPFAPTPAQQQDAWSQWEPLGSPDDKGLAGTPAAASWAVGRLDVIVRAADANLWQIRTADGGKSWSGWRPLGSPLDQGTTSSPAAVSWGLNRLDVFVRGRDNAIWHKHWSDDNGWSNWDSIGSPNDRGATSPPAVASWGVNRLDVFVRDQDGNLSHKRWTNDKLWGAWEPLGSPLGKKLTSAPGVVSWGVNRIDVFARGANNALWQIRWTDDNQWSDWRDVDHQNA
jgi:Concanavalin A-like lectin/glucanases superfamily